MEEEGSQQPQLVLAEKLFLLRQPVQDIDKVRYKEDVFTHIKENGNSLSLSLSSPFDFSPSETCSPSPFCSEMVPLYETLVADSVLDLDRALLDFMRAKIEDELTKLDEKWVSLSLYLRCLRRTPFGVSDLKFTRLNWESEGKVMETCTSLGYMILIC